MVRLAALSFFVSFFICCSRAIQSLPQEQEDPESETPVPIRNFRSYLIRGSIMTTTGELCSGKIRCLSDTGVVAGADTGPSSSSFEIRLSPKQFEQIKELQVYSLITDTIVEKFNGVTYRDSIIHRDYRLFFPPQKHMVLIQENAHTHVETDRDTTWLSPHPSAYTPKFIIRPKHDKYGFEYGMPVDTIRANADGTFD